MCTLESPCGGVVLEDVEAARAGAAYYLSIRVVRCLNGHTLESTRTERDRLSAGERRSAGGKDSAWRNTSVGVGRPGEAASGARCAAR